MTADGGKWFCHNPRIVPGRGPSLACRGWMVSGQCILGWNIEAVGLGVGDENEICVCVCICICICMY